MNEEYFSKRKIILKGCFYKDGFPISLDEITENNNKDLIVLIDNNSIDIQENYNNEIRKVNEFLKKSRDDHMSEIGINPLIDSDILKNDEKYEGKKPEDILDFIFNGGY